MKNDKVQVEEPKPEPKRADPNEPWSTYPGHAFDFLQSDFVEDLGALRINYEKEKSGAHVSQNVLNTPTANGSLL